jgi:transcriptional regulator with XRE-family HTH domain
MQTFGERLRELRLAQGHSQIWLADETGLNPATIVRIELGQSGPPRRSTLRLLAYALGTTVDELVNGAAA